MSASHFILLVESPTSSTDPLAAQLVRLGVEPIRVADLAEAVEVVKSKQYAVSAVLVPAELPGRLIRKAMKSMRRREPVLPAMAFGKSPDRSQRRFLRQAGILLALWDGYDESMLRFQINRLVSGEQQTAVRGSRRAPTQTPTRIMVGGREKSGILYSLAEGGCFIESPRASMEGAALRLLFILDEMPFELDGIVAFSNVPGNLQRPNLPLGMGIRFDGVDDGTRRRLADYIGQRMSELEV
ncbi:MAG: PilZ domain-containing protein [Myxococcota bacterium]